MPWKIDLVLMLRSLIGDLDNAKFTDERLKQILVFGAYNVINDADFSTTYNIEYKNYEINQISVTKYHPRRATKAFARRYTTHGALRAVRSNTWTT